MRKFLLPLLLTCAASIAGAQQPYSTPQAPASQAPSPEHRGTIIFSRSADDTSSPNEPAKTGNVVSIVTDADRESLAFTRYALDIHLQPADHGITVHAQLEVKNDSEHPLRQLSLQLSSSLHWELIRLIGVNATDLKFAESTIASDTDHTGAINEAAVQLPEPLAPAASLHLDVFYSGTIVKDARRLEQIGTPVDVAQSSDWDELSPAFTGLRGFGNVLWYPASSIPAKLGDGDKLFAEISATRLRQAASTVQMKLTAEVAGAAPNIAVLNGVVEPIHFTPGDPVTHLPGIAVTELPQSPLGFQTLSLFLANRQKFSGDAIDIYTRPGDEGLAQAYFSAGTLVTPLLHRWLGEQPKGGLSIFDLADAGDAPFEERQTLFTGLQTATADQLASPLSHSLTHGYFQSPRPWLNEGVASFIASLWVEEAHDREVALAQLDEQRGALALVEPGEEAAGNPRAENPGLLTNPNAIFYRTKATYVLWMLRSILGDTPLQNALKLYDPAKDTTDNYFENLLTRASLGLPASQELHQFFEDWVYHDRGLPDLSITGVYPSQANVPGTYLIAVDVANAGNAGADVPVTISSINTQVTERLFVPAHNHAVKRLLIQGEPTQVQVNDGIVPETTASVHVQQIHYTQPANP